jgi:hypothetical protein
MNKVIEEISANLHSFFPNLRKTINFENGKSAKFYEKKFEKKNQFN